MNANQTRGRVAAFFDLDGTLLPLPSLERRFVGTLRGRNAIPAKNYFRWLAQAFTAAGNPSSPLPKTIGHIAAAKL